MVRVCPNPKKWNEVYRRLHNYAQSHDCTPPSPPKPLILAGWVYSNDVMKMEVWKETVSWAENNNCLPIVTNIPDQDYYFVETLSDYAVGPYGGPMYREWDFEEKTRPSLEKLEEAIKKLRSNWSKIVGNELGKVTKPVAFKGKKARRLLVFAEADAEPPWGGWTYRSKNKAKRKTFTNFRKAINDTIAPHEVDHIDFIHDDSDI